MYCKVKKKQGKEKKNIVKNQICVCLIIDAYTIPSFKIWFAMFKDNCMNLYTGTVIYVFSWLSQLIYSITAQIWLH